MTPALRKAALTTHIVCSVGWLGAVASFFVLSIAGVASDVTDLVRSAYVAMNLLGWFLIIPLCLASLATGLVLALGTDWGLFRKYWVLVKFLLTIGATILLVVHQIIAVSEAARRVSDLGLDSRPDVGRLGTQLVGDSGLALMVLLGITILSVVKPWGSTNYGRRREQEHRDRARSLVVRTSPSEPRQAGSPTLGPTLPAPPTISSPDPASTATKLPLGLRIFLVVSGVAVVAVVVIHLLGGGLGRHSH